MGLGHVLNCTDWALPAPALSPHFCCWMRTGSVVLGVRLTEYYPQPTKPSRSMVPCKDYTVQGLHKEPLRRAPAPSLSATGGVVPTANIGINARALLEVLHQTATGNETQ